MNKNIEQRLRKQLDMIKRDAQGVALMTERAIEMLNDLCKLEKPLTKEVIEDIVAESVADTLKNVLFEKLEGDLDAQKIALSIQANLEGC